MRSLMARLKPCIQQRRVWTRPYEADLVIGAVLIPGASAPKLVRRDQLKQMQLSAVLVDIAIDQGGCFETSKPTTHADPIYEIDGILHYCVANMPGAVPRTSTYALNNATLPLCCKSLIWGACGCQFQSTLGQWVDRCRWRNRHAQVASDLGMAFELPEWYAPV